MFWGNLLHPDARMAVLPAPIKVVKMMVSSEGAKVAAVGTADSTKQAQNVVVLCCGQIAVTIGPYFP